MKYLIKGKLYEPIKMGDPEDWHEDENDTCHDCGAKWKYFECGSLEEGIKDLNEGLNEEYKKPGFSRSSDTYGYFTDSEIEK